MRAWFAVNARRARQLRWSKALAGGVPPVEPGEQTQTYTEDATTDFPNPERGWYRVGNNESSTLYPITGGAYYTWDVIQPYAPIAALTSIRLCQKIVRLDNYRGGSLGSTYIAAHAAEFATFRNSKRKAIVRYSYGGGGSDDAPFSVVMGHISELSAVWNDYQDVIAVLQLGFIGHYGEWGLNTSSNNLLDGSDANGPYRFQIIQAVLDGTPNTMHIALRYPRDMGPNDNPSTRAGFFDGQGFFQAADRFTTSDRARLGFYNDCYLNNAYNGSWWDPWDGTTTTRDEAITDSVNPYTPMGGETCANPPYGGSSGSVATMDRTSLDYLHTNYNTAVIDYWAAEAHPSGGTYLAYISRMMGYRLSLVQVTAPTNVGAGQAMNIGIRMKNGGWGKVINRRPMDLVFVGSGGPFTVRMTADARRVLPLAGATEDLSFSFAAPAGLVSGQAYALHLRMPDPSATLEDDNDFAVRLANTSVWDAATGRNDLHVSVTVGSETPPDENPNLEGVGSTSTSLTDYPNVTNVTTGNWYVDGSVSSSGNGTTLSAAFKTLAEGLAALGDGETLLVKGGTYYLTSTISRNSGWTSQTRIMGYGNDRPVLNFSGISARCISFGGSAANELWHRFHITNNNMVRGEVHTGHEGMYATTGASDLVWSDIWASHLGGEGFRFYRVDDSQVLDCATWRLGDPNLDPNWVSPPDGFICSGSGTTGGESNRNVFARCVAINAPDDGFDCFSGIDTMYVDCVAIKAGKYYDGTSGRGRNGFKMGGGTGSGNTAKGCFSYDCGRGFEDNGGTNVTFLSGTATACDWVGVNGPTSTTVVTDMISLANDSTNYNVGGTDTYNTWNLSIADAGWASPGTPDWDYSLASGSACIGVGASGGNLGASTVALELAKVWLPVAEEGAGPPEPPEPPPSETTLLGVGSVSTSLVDYPKVGAIASGDWYVDPNASTNGSGTYSSPFDNLASALAAVSDGQTILVRAGTLACSATFYRNTSWATGINVYNYGTERPVLDFQSNPNTGNAAKGVAFGSSASREHWKGFEVINTKDIAFDLSGTNLTVEDMWVHHCYLDTTTNVGRGVIRSYRTGTNNHLVQDCVVYRCGSGSGTSTNVHDCYQVTAALGTTNSGVTFVRCFGANGADDCFDLFRGNGCSFIDCVAFEGGYHYNGNTGADGSGFKLGGGNTGVGNNAVRGSIAIGCKSEAIKPNSSPEPITAVNCTCVDAVGYGFSFSSGDGVGDKHVVTDCIEYGSGSSPPLMSSTYVTDTYNTWNDPADAGGNADFPIADPLFAAALSYDWSLAEGSACIAAGASGGNLGASDVALEIAKAWLAEDLAT